MLGAVRTQHKAQVHLRFLFLLYLYAAQVRSEQSCFRGERRPNLKACRLCSAALLRFTPLPFEIESNHLNHGLLAYIRTPRSCAMHRADALSPTGCCGHTASAVAAIGKRNGKPTHTFFLELSRVLQRTPHNGFFSRKTNNAQARSKVHPRVADFHTPFNAHALRRFSLQWSCVHRLLAAREDTVPRDSRRRTARTAETRLNSAATQFTPTLLG